MLLINKFRMLWEQDDVWTRETINGIVFELPNLDLVIQRLLRNPGDFAEVFRKFYGDRIADRLKELFTEHLVLAADLVNAAKAGDRAAAERIEREWFENAETIAKFFGNINPFWSRREWQEMMFEHLNLVKAEAVFLLEGNFEKNIEVYDKIEEQTLEMADEMAEGIIRQFCLC
ncbi:MAG: acetylglutamate kinase [Bacilli bacterium]